MSLFVVQTHVLFLLMSPVSHWFPANLPEWNKFCLLFSIFFFIYIYIYSVASLAVLQCLCSSRSGNLQHLVLWQERLSTDCTADGQVSNPDRCMVGPSSLLSRWTKVFWFCFSSRSPSWKEHVSWIIECKCWARVPLKLSPRIVKQEAEHAKRGSPERAEPQRTNGVAEPRPIDILELLSKAKEEYQRVRSPASTPGQKHAAGRATCENNRFIFVCPRQRLVKQTRQQSTWWDLQSTQSCTARLSPKRYVGIMKRLWNYISELICLGSLRTRSNTWMEALVPFVTPQRVNF